ncbi:MAG TPA: hypothetical protein VFY19_05325 [Geminicoccaceae bacterium]|nr:hypothetical protein [Geminicoccaceae bacterium]
MYVVYGSALSAGAILAIALLTLLFANPSAPRWTQRELTAQLASVVVTMVLGLGLGCLVFLAPQQIKAEGLTLVEVAALGAALALIVLVLRALRVGARVRAYQASALTIPVVPPAA